MVRIVSEATGFYLLQSVFRTYSKIYMKLFAKIVNGSKPLTIFAKSPIVDSDGVLNAPLSYPLVKVHRLSTKQSA